MVGASERGAFRRSRWSQGVRGPADVAAAAAGDESRIAIDSHEVGSAVPADRFGSHALSSFSKPVSPQISRMTRMGKTDCRWDSFQSGRWYDVAAAAAAEDSRGWVRPEAIP